MPNKRPIQNPITFTSTVPVMQANGAYKQTWTATRRGVSVSLDAVFENLASARKQLDLNQLRERLEGKLVHRETHLAGQVAAAKSKK